MAMLTNDIYIGSVSTPLYHFENDKIELGNTKGMFALDVIGNELSIDQFTIGIHWTEDDSYDGFITSEDDDFILANDDELTVLISEAVSPSLKDFLKELPYGTPIWWYVDSEFYCKGYLKSVDRVTKNGFKLTCTSGVGLLETAMHTGNLYQAAAITDVLASIIGSTFTYTVSNAVQATRVYGRLPYDTCRNNLHRLLFATGAALMKGDEDTDYVIDYLSENTTDVPASRVALQGSVEYQLPSNRVEITEHAFFYNASAATETLFDNSAETPADNLTVIFENPVYVASLAATGTLTVDESGVNYAVVSGLGTLTGKYYVHTTQIDVLENNPNNEPVRVRRVTDCELVSALNARNVARRVLSYYQSAKTVKAKILLDGEQCGNLIRMTDAFGDITQAYIAKMDTLITTVVGAQCVLVEGFSPDSNGNNFLHRVAITKSGTWTVPLDIEVDETGKGTIRLALIAGGNGGKGGYDGADGAYTVTSLLETGEVTRAYDQLNDAYSYYYANQEQRLPAGGAAGSAGAAGKVLVIERKVEPGEEITFNIGAGGSGGARNGGAGTAGTATSASSTNVGNVSSDDGVVTQGYFDPFNGELFAAPGTPGYKGGNGGRTDTVNLYGFSGGNGLPGENVADFIGGAGGTGMTRSMYSSEVQKDIISYASGGGGGGAAYGANGTAGKNAYFTPSHSEPSPGPEPGWIIYGDRLTSGGGSDGASALPFQKPTYGQGGGGGNGGGGGGNCGCGYGPWGSTTSDNQYSYPYIGGKGGKGSVGGAGGDGIGIIYY